MMNDTRITTLSKRLSWLLRHGAGTEGLTMDEAGWVPVEEVLARLRMRPAELDVVVARNNKQRLQRVGDRVRCCQGHSTEDMPVTQEALEASWARRESAAPVFHGTWSKALPAIAREGLLPQRRTHVHLTDRTDSPVGKRAQVSFLLEIDTVGLPLWVAPNGVVLARRVPAAHITAVHAATRRGERELCSARALFGL